MNAGTSSKLSMDMQQTASNQSSVRTGTENIHHDQDQIKHEGSTHIYGPNGEHYEVNGTTTVTAGGMQASGIIQQYDKHGNVVKQWEGNITASGKNMGAFTQDSVNGNEASYQATEIITKNLSNNENINERNTYQAGKQVVDNTEINKRDSYKYGSEYINNNVNDTRNIIKRGSETTEGDKFTHDSSTTVTTGVKEDHSNIRQTGDKETNYGKTQEYSNAYGSLMAGGHDGVHADMYRDFVAMKNGNISQEQFEAKVMNYAKQISADMPSSLSKDMSFGQGSDAKNSNSSTETTQLRTSMSVGASGSVGPDLKGAGSAGVNFGGSAETSHAYTNQSGISNIKSYTNQKGGSVSQDMMAQHIKNEMIGNMESLYKNGGMTHNGESIGQQLSNELSDFVGNKVNKPF